MGTGLACLRRIAAVALFSIAAQSALAEDGFPTRSIGIKVPFAPGGAGDILARTVAQFTSAETGWQLYIENISGAAGLVGAQAAARSTPDGYTVLLCNISCATDQFVTSNSNWDAKAALTPVIALGYLANILVVGPSIQADTLQDFISRARDNPEQVAVATSGPGTSSSLTAEMLEAKAGIKLRKIPYRGSAAAMPDLIAGRVDGMFMGIPESLAFIRDHKVKALGVTSMKRAPSLPDVPTVAEGGVPGYHFVNWSSFFVPMGTPDELVKRLNAGFNKALSSQPLLARLFEMSFETLGGPPEAAGRLLDDDIALWGPILEKQRKSDR